MHLRPARVADHARIDAWLTRPDIQRWWGSASAARAEVQLARESPSAICRIIEADGLAIGYGHAVDAALWGHDLPSEIPAGTYDIDLFIAEPAHRARGLGRAALRALAAEVFSTTFALAVCVLAPVRNETATRAYEKAGFRWVRVWQDPVFGPCWIMVMDRS